MDEKKYLVPEGMLEAFLHEENHDGTKWDDEVLNAMLAAALRWLAENPIVPTDEQIRALWSEVCKSTPGSYKHGLVEWQRRMFLAAEPEIPEAVKDLMWERVGFAGFTNDRESYNDNILEAYRRGRISHDEK